MVQLADLLEQRSDVGLQVAFISKIACLAGNVVLDGLVSTSQRTLIGVERTFAEGYNSCSLETVFCTRSGLEEEMMTVQPFSRHASATP